MKKLLFFLVLLFLFQNNSIAQPDSSRFIIKISPITFAFGDYVTESNGINLALEKKINHSTSIQQEIGYIKNSSGGTIFLVDIDKIYGLHFDTEYRRYISQKKRNLEGFYLSANLRTNLTKAVRRPRNPYTVKRILFASHMSIGWQDISIASPFTFDIVVGVGGRFVTSNSSVPLEEIFSTSYDRGKAYDSGHNLGGNLRFDIKLGYAF